MTQTICPGQDTRYWRPDDVFEVACSECGYGVEFFKDDAARRCKGCGKKIQNPKLNLGCAQWCEHAKECLGYDPKEKLAQADGAQESLIDQLIKEMKLKFGQDQKRISHALSVLDYAQRILAQESLADPKVVLSAAVLHDIGIQEAEKKHGSSAGRFQEKEGPAIADRIMKKMNLDELTRDHVCRIVANHHSAKDIDTIEFRIIWDSDWLVNIADVYPDADHDKLIRLIDRIFRTETGRQLAERIYLGQPSQP